MALLWLRILLSDSGGKSFYKWLMVFENTANSDSNPRRFSLESSGEALTLTAAALGTAALVLASRGRNLTSLATAGTSEGLLGAAVKSQLKTEAKTANLVFSLGEGEATAVRSKALDEAQRGIARQVKKETLPEAIQGAEIEAEAHALMRYRQATGRVPLNPENGKPLSSKHQFKAAYVDSMPTRFTPEFSSSGRLMPGRYPMGFSEFSRQFGQGKEREALLKEFHTSLQIMKAMDIETVHVGGSFVSKKAAPADVDFMWNKFAGKHNQDLSRQTLGGLYESHSPFYLMDRGLQMLTEPAKGGSYKSMQYFLSHHGREIPVLRNGQWTVKEQTVPNGIVELDLSSIQAYPASWLKYRAR